MRIYTLSQIFFEIRTSILVLHTELYADSLRTVNINNVYVIRIVMMSPDLWGRLVIFLFSLFNLWRYTETIIYTEPSNPKRSNTIFTLTLINIFFVFLCCSISDNPTRKWIRASTLPGITTGQFVIVFRYLHCSRYII